MSSASEVQKQKFLWSTSLISIGDFRRLMPTWQCFESNLRLVNPHGSFETRRNEYPPVVKHGNGKWTMSGWFSFQKLPFSSGIFPASQSSLMTPIRVMCSIKSSILWWLQSGSAPENPTSFDSFNSTRGASPLATPSMVPPMLKICLFSRRSSTKFWQDLRIPKRRASTGRVWHPSWDSFFPCFFPVALGFLSKFGDWKTGLNPAVESNENSSVAKMFAKIEV